GIGKRVRAVADLDLLDHAEGRGIETHELNARIRIGTVSTGIPGEPQLVEEKTATGIHEVAPRCTLHIEEPGRSPDPPLAGRIWRGEIGPVPRSHFHGSPRVRVAA